MRHLRRLGHCLAAGALAGGVAAPLQLLLWPELSLSPARALLALAMWGSWGALWGGLAGFLAVEAAGVFVPAIAARRGFRLSLWWPLAFAVGIVAAAIAWWNREQTRELLAGTHRDGLSAAMVASGLYVIAVAAIAARPAAHRRPVLSAALPAAALLAAVWGIWASVEPALPPPAPARSALLPVPPKVLLVSWEGADLPWLLPAIERGDMPFLRTRRDRGAWGALRTLRPYARSAFFATLATSCSPAVHGVIGRRAYRLGWLSDTPVSLVLAGPWPTPHVLPWRAWERAAPPPSRRAHLWEILARAGARVGVAGWPGVVRSTWAVPQPIAAEAAPYSTLDPELQAALEPSLAAFPELAPATRAAFAVDAHVARRVDELLAAQPVDALVLNSDLPARLRPLWTFDEPAGPQADVLQQAAGVLDRELQRAWMALGGEQVLLAVVSPYGLKPPSTWRRLWSSAEHLRRWRVSAADEPDGLILLSGPGVRNGVRLRGARLADVTATLLYLLELPVARDMVGRVLLEAVDEERAAATPLRLIPSYGPPSPRTAAD